MGTKSTVKEKAKAYLEMINGILNYYCKDLLNP